MSAPPPFPTVSFPKLGTTATVVVTDAVALEAATALLREELDAIDAACSRFRDDSELSRANAAADGTPRPIGPLFAEAVAVALRAAAATDGAVDPTIGGALVTLGYDRDFASLPPRIPTPVLRLATVPGWRRVVLDRDAGLLMLPAGVSLDLGATAKALAADRAALRIADATGTGVLVSLGGDIRVAGPAPGAGWPVRVTDDHRRLDGDGQTVAVATGGLATSSTTVRRWVAGDEARHHIVDPRSGRPALEAWRTVTVVAATCVDANAAATATVVKGEAAPAWLERLGLAARLVRPDGETLRVAGWPAAQ